MFPPAHVRRRTFIKSAAAFAFFPPTTALSSSVLVKSHFPGDFSAAPNQLLDMVNAERAKYGLSQLQLDTAAGAIADAHAADMLEGRFLSHWGRDGRKPYHRYSFAGGTEAIQENVSSSESFGAIIPPLISESLAIMHQRMFDEVPPNDGHRKTILDPNHTHVAFGFAATSSSVRLDEIYLARYLEIDSIPRTNTPGAEINVRGRLLNPKHKIRGVAVHYEPLPTPPDIAWLRTTRSCGLPDTAMHLLPRLQSNFFYPDGSIGVIELLRKGTFRTPIKLFPKPGINTIVVWIQGDKKGRQFPATEVCIRCE